ncbi:hypothetical protein F4820DRAFT_439139 [Hypoxylon rubiginosum]|uniref:Uncharacterized protein n=1 Tax=Hypoxylon rubiginosum TaxID=110542 RepID=A0ACB9YJT1_9PEZI|nr:hypothetical protein F4820DRAFT_439139 [Hypoxylon rubiginosum]
MKSKDPDNARGSVIFPIPSLPKSSIHLAAAALNFSSNSAYVDKVTILSGNNELWQRTKLRKRADYEIDLSHANIAANQGGKGIAVVLEVVFDTNLGEIVFESVGLKVVVAVERVLIQSGTWDSQDVRAWNEPHEKTEGRIKFLTDFNTTPVVMVGMISADVSGGTNFRVKVYATDIDLHGFTIHADTCNDTKVYSCGVSWVAHGS